MKTITPEITRDGYTPEITRDRLLLDDSEEKIIQDITPGRVSSVGSFYNILRWLVTKIAGLNDSLPIPELLVNQNAPDFSLPDVDGGIHRLHDLRGSLVRQAD